jgi:hypothetical protein
MKVIDKILNEWSFRCHDGIVDINDPIKLSILKEIMIEEGIDDDILDATLNLPKDDPSSEEKKQQVLAILTGTSGEKNKEEEEIKQIKDEVTPKDFKTIYNKIIPYLEKDKGLPDKETLALISTFVLKDEEEDLINYYKANHKFDINSDESILNVPINGGLKKDTVEDIYKIFSGGAGGGKGVGKEEYFLVAFYSNVKKEKEKGDLIIDNIKYEIKGNEAMVSPYPRGRKEHVYPILDKLIKSVEDSGVSVPKEVLEKIKLGGEKWVSSVTNLGNEYFKDNIGNYLEILQDALREIYKGITLGNVLENGDISDNLVAICIAQHSIDKYEVDAKEQFIFVSKSGEIKIIPTKEKLKELINNGINIFSFSDLVPRLTYKGINTFAIKEPSLSKIKSKPKEKITIKISKAPENIKKYSGKEYISRNWYNSHESLQKYFDETQSIKNFIPLKPEYQNTVELIPYNSLEEELTNSLIKSITESIK